MYDLAWYVFTEMANNVRQHGRGVGCVSAQVNRAEGLVRLAIADNGGGVLKSFEGLDWSAGMTDAEAVRKALEPRVSSKGSPTNEGVGLTLVAGLVEQHGLKVLEKPSSRAAIVRFRCWLRRPWIWA